MLPPKRANLLLLGLLLLGCAHNPRTIRVNKQLTMRPSIELVQLHRWRDGGSRGFHIRDSVGQEIRFCLDLQINTQTPWLWYLGDTHARREAARLAEIDSPTEHALNRLLHVWLSEHQGATDSASDHRLSDAAIVTDLPQKIAAARAIISRPATRQSPGLQGRGSGSSTSSDKTAAPSSR